MFILQLVEVKGAVSKIVPRNWEFLVMTLNTSTAPTTFFKGGFICLINNSRVLSFYQGEQNKEKRFNVSFAHCLEKYANA
jgi:hypothetical protein